MGAYEYVARIVESLLLIDAHEHLEPESGRLSGSQDPLPMFLTHYLSTDFLVAGMGVEELERLRNSEVPWESRWELFEEWWGYAQTTGYGQVIRLAIRDLYGVEELSRNSYPKLLEAMEKAARPGFYRWVLRERGGIEKCILDRGVVRDYDRDLFVPVIRLDDLIGISTRAGLRRLCEKLHKSIHSIDELESGFRKYIRDRLKEYVGVKVGLAYERTLYFEDVERCEAERALKLLLCGNLEAREYTPGFEELKPLQDYLMHLLLRELEELG
ncbi:MAG: hypothetical protein DRJ43_05905, partial [Thermoprotei archaeon]